MIAWRIARSAHQALDGDGARLYGGRWNTEGKPVVYGSASLSLAALEYLIHLEPLLAPNDLVAIEIDVPDDTAVGAQVAPEQFPPGNWQHYPAPDWQAELGDLWLADATFLWLAVPSVIVPREYNILINPQHPRMGDVRIASTRPFAFDKRLM